MSTNYLVTQPGPVCAGPASPTPHLAWGVYSGAVLSGLVAGQQAALQIDSAGNLLVNVAVGGGGGGGGTVNQGTPGLVTAPWFVKLSDGTNPLGTGSNPLRIDPTGTTVQPVSGTVTANQGTANTLANAWPNELTDGTNGPVAVKAASTAAVATDKALVVAVSPNNSVAVTGTFFQATQPVSGTVTADIVGHAGAILDGTAGTPSTGVLTVQGVSGGTTIPVTATVAASQTIAVTQATAANLNATVVGALTNNNAAPSSNNVGVLPALANQVSPVWTEGDQELVSVDLAGNQRIVASGVPSIVQRNSFVSTGSVASLACAYSSNVHKGTLLIIVASVGNGTTPTITDTQANSYALAGLTYQLGPASAFGVGVWYARSKTAGANTITVNNGGTTASIAATIYEISGAAVGAYPDFYISSAGTSATLTNTGSAGSTFAPNSFGILGVAVGTAAQTINIPSPVLSLSIQNEVLQECLTNDSGQQNPVTPAGLFSFATGSGIFPHAVSWSNPIVGTLGGSEPYAVVNVWFKPYAQAISGQVSLLGQGLTQNNTNQGLVLPVSFLSSVATPDATTSAETLSNASTYSLVGTSTSIFNGTTFDRARSASIGNVQPATGLPVSVQYGEFLNAAPAFGTTGDYSAIQIDAYGSQFVKPYRRSQTVSQATTIAATTTTTTVLAAQAAGVFADISSFIITVTPSTATAAAFIATLSDGTKSYVYDLMFGGTLGTAVSDDQTISFNPPLPASTAATAWTVTLSTSSPTVHITVVAVLQTAS